MNERNDDQKKEFIDYISQQTVNKVMYKDWGERCVHKMNGEIDRVIDSSRRLLQKVYYCQQNMANKEKEFQRMKDNLYDPVRKIAKKSLPERQKEAGEAYSFSFSDEEIEREFEEFCQRNKEVFDSQSVEKSSHQENETKVFFEEIAEMYGNAPGFAEISSKFGTKLENQFKKEWVRSRHVQFANNIMVTVQTFPNDGEEMSLVNRIILT